MNPEDQIVRNFMFENDAFSKWLGVEILVIKRGYCKAKMKVRSKMLNGFKIAHGGISFSFADSVFAFASNSLGDKAVSIETNISHLRAVYENDILTAESKSVKEGSRFSIYEVEVKNQDDKLVAHFKGTVYKSGEKWI